MIWTYRGAKAWYPLTSAQFPGYQAVFDRLAPKRLRGFAPPFLTAVPRAGRRPGLDRLLHRERGELERAGAPAREPAAQPRLRPVRGIVETDRWFGPLFTNLRLVKTDVPIHFSTETPLVQVQPLQRSTYADEVSNGFAVVGEPARFSDRGVVALRGDDRQAKPRSAAPGGAYAASARRRRGAAARCTAE